MSLNFLTPSDLEKAMKKQLEDVQAEIEKSQAKLLDKMKKAMRVELRRVSEVTPNAPIKAKSDEDKKEGTDRKERKLATLNKYAFSPVNLNAKLNDSDALPKVNNRRRSNAGLQKTEAASPPGTPRNLPNPTSSFGQDPAHTAGGEAEHVETVASRNSARGLARQQRDEEIKRTRDSLVENRENTTAADGFEPLIDTEATETRGQEEAKLEWLAILQNPFLEGSIVCIIIMNALWVGIALEYKLTVSEVRPSYFDWIDIVFCILFSLELLLRISVLRLGFFDTMGPQWTWNYFDLLLVLSQIMEIMLRLLDSNLRILRILRIVRLARIVRAVRFIEGLRTLIKHVFRGMTATAWITLFLAMQIYTCSLAFAELLHELRNGHTSSLDNGDEFDSLFGSLLNTMGTLYKSITFGIAWDTALGVLMEVWPPLGFVFVIHITFNILVILNVFTGFFIKTSATCADEDSKAIVRDRVADIFGLDEKDHHVSTVDEAYFTDRLNSPEMQSYLNQIDLHVDEAEGLFQLLDLNGNGTLDPMELVSGLMRIRGSAKALDIRILMYMVTKSQEINHEHLNSLEDKIASIHGSIASLQPQEDTTIAEVDGA